MVAVIVAAVVVVELTLILVPILELDTPDDEGVAADSSLERIGRSIVCVVVVPSIVIVVRIVPIPCVDADLVNDDCVCAEKEEVREGTLVEPGKGVGIPPLVALVEVVA